MGQFVASMRREMDVPEQVEAYLASQPGPKQADLRRLHAHILAEFPGCRLWFSGVGTVTVELAVTWARLPAGIKPITADFRLSEVRGFARYLHAIDPAHEVPPPGLLGSRAGAPRPTSTRRARSPRSCARPSGYSHRCGRPPTGRCSACWQRRACAWGRQRR